MGFGRASHRHRARRDPAVALRMRLKELAESRVRDGYRRLHVLLQREGWRANDKRIYRLYNEERVSIRTRSPRRRRASRTRSGRSQANAMNDVWAMDFVSDLPFDDRPFVRLRLTLTIADCHTREALATTARTNFRAYRVIEELDGLARTRVMPRSLRSLIGGATRRRRSGSPTPRATPRRSGPCARIRTSPGLASGRPCWLPRKPTLAWRDSAGPNSWPPRPAGNSTSCAAGARLSP